MPEWVNAVMAAKLKLSNTFSSSAFNSLTFFSKEQPSVISLSPVCFLSLWNHEQLFL
jgi:hypothetical protein